MKDVACSIYGCGRLPVEEKLPHTSRPRISVIIPVFDTEKYIERCLRSVMEQTITDIEIICVDDCSPDRSVEIIHQLMAEDSRIKLIRHDQNRGLGGARNTGIMAANAEYIASVDSDDTMKPDMLKSLLAGTGGGHFDVVVCGFERVDQEGKTLSRHQSKVKVIDPMPGYIDPFTISNPAFWNKLWRRSLFVDNNIFFPQRLYYQDQATTARIYSRARNVNFIGGCHYRYLMRLDSVTNRVSDKHQLDRFRVFDVLKDHFAKGNTSASQSAFFSKLIDSGFRYHAENVAANNDINDPVIAQYLRHMLLLRHAYATIDDKVRMMTPATTLRLLKEPAKKIAAILSNEKQRWPNGPRILILTLHSGENEFDRCVEVIKSQTCMKLEHKVFSGLGNVEAHQAIYSEIMSRTTEFDLFMKIDADMILAADDAIATIVKQFEADQELDHYVVHCHDFMTGKPILGMHTFSSRVQWAESAETLFVDPNPKCPGRRVVEKSAKVPLVWHAPDPHDFQAFHFGAHRALKISQPSRSVGARREATSRLQWRVLRDTWRQYRKNRDRRHGLALIAADLVFRKKLGANAADYRDPMLAEEFARASQLTDRQIQQFVGWRWRAVPLHWVYLTIALGPRLSFAALRKTRNSPRSKGLAGFFKPAKVGEAARR